jgi:hypothetical protein
VDGKDIFIGGGVSGYHAAPEDRDQWPKAEHDLQYGGILIVRWLDRISRRYDELHRIMHQLMGLRVRVECTLNGMALEGNAKGKFGIGTATVKRACALKQVLYRSIVSQVAWPSPIIFADINVSTRYRVTTGRP